MGPRTQDSDLDDYRALRPYIFCLFQGDEAVSSSTLPVPHLLGRGCRFTIVPPAGHKYTLKDGTVKVYTGKNPQGTAWADEGGSNYSEDDQKLQKAISRGWGHGLVCGTGGVVVFEATTLRAPGAGVLQRSPHRPGGEQARPRHHHLLTQAYRRIRLYDPILQKRRSTEDGR